MNLQAAVDSEAIAARYRLSLSPGMGCDVNAIEAADTDAVAAAVQCTPDVLIVDAPLSD